MKPRSIVGLLAVAAATAAPVWAQTPVQDGPPLLALSQQILVREGWLTKRHALILDMMRRHGIDMWVWW